MSRGVTLVELLIVLVVLGVVVAMSTMTRGLVREGRRAETGQDERLRAGRAKAIRTGLPVQVAADSGQVVLLLPDGRAIGSDLDPLTGEPRNASR